MFITTMPPTTRIIHRYRHDDCRNGAGKLVHLRVEFVNIYKAERLLLTAEQLAFVSQQLPSLFDGGLKCFLV